MSERTQTSGGDGDRGAAEQAPAITFPAFVLSLAHTVAVHLGDVPDPSTGEPGKVNLEAAQHMIDILALLEEKTRGNLSVEERQLLDQLLFELRMRFVEVKKADSPPDPASRIILP